MIDPQIKVDNILTLIRQYRENIDNCMGSLDSAIKILPDGFYIASVEFGDNQLLHKSKKGNWTIWSKPNDAWVVFTSNFADYNSINLVMRTTL